MMLLEIKNVTKNYKSPGLNGLNTVLKEINLRMEAGETVSVTGPSGSGKSTLLNVIGCLVHPDSGSIRLDGKELSGLPDEEQAAVRNRDIGFVFQLHHLLPQCTLLENVLLPTLAAEKKTGEKKADDRARRLLARVGLEKRIFHRPGQLSGGECQRAAVVRALINQPRLLLADEPTGSLDGAAAHNLGSLLLELNKEEGVALIVVTHSLELAAGMQRQYHIRNGKLSPRG